MQYINFDQSKKFDLILLGRVAVDLNPVDYNCPLDESTTFKRYLGGSPANIAVGLARLGKKCGFFARVSDDQLGTFVTKYFEKEGIDTSHIVRCANGEKIGLTFTEIKSPTESSILMYRNMAADLKLDVEDIDEEYIKQGKAILISGTALAESPSREAALKAVMLAKRNGVPVIFDIDYRSYNWKNADEISIYYSAVAREADIILGSREEYDLTEATPRPPPTGTGRTRRSSSSSTASRAPPPTPATGRASPSSPSRSSCSRASAAATATPPRSCTGCSRAMRSSTRWNSAPRRRPCWWRATPALRICPRCSRSRILSKKKRKNSAK